MIIGKCTDVFREIFWLGGRGWEDGDILGELSMEDFVMGKENLHERSTGFSSIIKKNNVKINMKKKFPLKVRSSINT